MPDLCPVTATYVKYIRGYLEDEIIFADVFEPQLDHYAEVIAMQSNSGNNTRARQHQRAFLCIEMMMHHIARGVSVQERQDSQYMTWDRSSVGLSQMIMALRSDNDDLTGAAMEYGFARGMLDPDGPVVKRRVGDGSDQMYQDNRHTLMEVYRLAGEAAVILRRALRNPETPLTRVGRRLGQAAEVSRASTTKLFSMAEALLNQREDHAPRAWEFEL